MVWERFLLFAFSSLFSTGVFAWSTFCCVFFILGEQRILHGWPVFFTATKYYCYINVQQAGTGRLLCMRALGTLEFFFFLYTIRKKEVLGFAAGSFYPLLG